ncbi:Rha family transcriptional regulator [Gluconobacter japonicus]|uniref:Rha family transcriptional regulator n=1 Tax=Gluconobacter japonicus TaxID=376620 RepID=UPI003D26F546
MSHDSTRAVTISSALSSGAPTMSSREIAELTGKRHRDVMRDIRVMLGKVEEDERKFARIYQDSHGRDQQEYALTQDLTYNLVLGYDPALRLKVVRRWMELETSVARAPTKRTRKPAFDVAYRRLLSVASTLPNVDENQRCLMAARGTHELTGINPLELMGATSIAAPDNTNYLTPTQIGEEIGMSARAVNVTLIQQGYQVKVAGSAVGSDYEPTEKGKEVSRFFDTTRRHGKGSQQQLKWSPRMVAILRPFAKKPEPAS